MLLQMPGYRGGGRREAAIVLVASAASACPHGAGVTMAAHVSAVIADHGRQMRKSMCVNMSLGAANSRLLPSPVLSLFPRPDIQFTVVPDEREDGKT
jgi:hypothetical protein